MKLLRIDSYSRGCPEIDSFITTYEQNRNKIDYEIQQKLIASGRCTPQQAARITETLYNQIMYSGEDGEVNHGLCGIIMGYDAIYGNTYHFDILNPSSVEVVKDYGV